MSSRAAGLFDGLLKEDDKNNYAQGCVDLGHQCEYRRSSRNVYSYSYVWSRPIWKGNGVYYQVGHWNWHSSFSPDDLIMPDMILHHGVILLDFSDMSSGQRQATLNFSHLRASVERIHPGGKQSSTSCNVRFPTMSWTVQFTSKRKDHSVHSETFLTFPDPIYLNMFWLSNIQIQKK